MQKDQSLAMGAKELKWHDIFVVLFGTILSFADPITDILTLVEFYRADHKTWFGVGLSFIILPCLFFAVLYGVSSKESELAEASRVRRFTQVFLFGFNPFSPALVKLQTLIFYLKKILENSGRAIKSYPLILERLPMKRRILFWFTAI